MPRRAVRYNLFTSEGGARLSAFEIHDSIKDVTASIRKLCKTIGFQHNSFAADAFRFYSQHLNFYGIWVVKKKGFCLNRNQESENRWGHLQWVAVDDCRGDISVMRGRGASAVTNKEKGELISTGLSNPLNGQFHLRKGEKNPQVSMDRQERPLSPLE